MFYVRSFLFKIMPKGIKGFQKGALNPSRNPKRAKEIREFMKGKIVSVKQRKKISLSMKKALKNPKLREVWRKNNLELN